MGDVIFTNPGKNWIRDYIKDSIDQSGIGIDATRDAEDTGLFGGGVTIEACDATTGWAAGGDGTGVTLNTTDGERKEGTGSLNLAITHSTGESTFTKTITSTDLTGDKVFVWVYFTDVSMVSKVSVLLGTSGVANANKYDTDGNLLSVGWNSLSVDVDSPDSTVGTGATETTIDTIQLLITHTSSPPGVIMDFWRYYEAGTKGITDSQKVPNISTGDRYIKTVHQVLSTESNGVEVTSAADFDDTIMPFVMTFTGVTKTDTSELQVDKFYFID